MLPWKFVGRTDFGREENVWRPGGKELGMLEQEKKGGMSQR